MTRFSDISAIRWLETAVIYNIYPQSFYDQNGDGIGDLAGIIEKLEYIRSLGVTAIWLNPIFPSPFRDAGYDIIDYYDVAPRYGTREDLRTLIERCHETGIRVLLDFVPGHTSVEHPWFAKSAKAEASEYSNRYIWSEGGFGDKDPTLIRGYSERDGHYKPNFFWFQPALNYGYTHPKEAWQLPTNHPDVRETVEEMEKIMRYWLDFGVDGFRVDMAASLVKEDPDNEGNRSLWRRVRAWMERDYPDRILISEWSWPSRAIDSGFHLDFMIHFCNDAYNSLFRFENGRNVFPDHRFSYFDRAGKGNILLFLKYYRKFLRKTKGRGYISIPTGNHDLPRINYGRSIEEIKIAYTFLFTLPGVPTLYYGDEIGMHNKSDAPNKEGGYLRTQARTPMQWSRERNAGFSTAPAESLYLPVDDSPQFPNVEEQSQDRQSLLQFVRNLIRLRKEHGALSASGAFDVKFARKNEYPFVYLRRKNRERILVVLNPSSRVVQSTVKTCAPLAAGPEYLNSGVSFAYEDGRLNICCEPLSYAVVDFCLARKHPTLPKTE